MCQQPSHVLLTPCAVMRIALIFFLLVWNWRRQQECLISGLVFYANIVGVNLPPVESTDAFSVSHKLVKVLGFCVTNTHSPFIGNNATHIDHYAHHLPWASNIQQNEVAPWCKHGLWLCQTHSTVHHGSACFPFFSFLLTLLWSCTASGCRPYHT